MKTQSSGAGSVTHLSTLTPSTPIATGPVALSGPWSLSQLRVRALRINIITEERLSFIKDQEFIRAIAARLKAEGIEPVYSRMVAERPHLELPHD